MIGLWLLLQYTYWFTYHNDSVNLYFTYLFLLFYRLREHITTPHHFYLHLKVYLWWLLCVGWECCLGHDKYLECWSSSQSKGWNKLGDFPQFLLRNVTRRKTLAGTLKGALQLLTAAAYPISSKACIWGVKKKGTCNCVHFLPGFC